MNGFAAPFAESRLFDIYFRALPGRVEPLLEFASLEPTAA